jgi:hypothetical protein
MTAMMGSRRWISVLALAILFVSISSGILVSGDSKNGTFTFTMYGYTVTGDLTNAIITHEGAVQMQMSIDQTIPTTMGTAHITGNGIWSGQTNFALFDGSIENVKGTIQACLLGACQNADFTGGGSWSGTLAWSKISGSQGSGTFQGTLNLTGASRTPAHPVSVSGNWTAAFTI